ncbi:MAG: DNA primase [Actinomycetaceae bacterium]|nr:DNA primase [Actinomycetaceae bacterium]
MSDASRELEILLDAFRAHYAVARDNEPDSEAVLEAESHLEDAFFQYDNALFTHLGAELPFDILMEDDDYDEDEDAEDLDDEEEADLILNEDAFDSIDLN